MRASCLSVLLCLLLAGPAAAAVHRCADAQGKTYFSDSACPMAPDAHRGQPWAEQIPPPLVAPAAGVSAPAAAANDWSPPPDPAASVDTVTAQPRRSFEETHKLAFGLAVALRITAGLWLLWIVYRQWGALGALAEVMEPLARLVFILQNFRMVLGPIVLFALSYMVLIGLGYAAFKAEWVQSRSGLYRCIGPDTTEPTPSTSFAYDDRVCLRTTLSLGSGHVVSPLNLQWRWYQGDTPGAGHMTFKQRQAQQQRQEQAVTETSLDWDGTAPREVLGQISARQLGSGAHSVSLYVRGQLTDTVNFEVR